MSLLGRLFGPSTTNEQTYTCECGAPMENTVVHSTTEFRIETWHCTDDECILTGRAYLCEEDGESYGEGVLAGQVDP
jgi:hypothetical protein